MIRLSVVTPVKKIYEDTVEMVVVPGAEGVLGILPNHTPLLTQIKPGEIKIKKNGAESYLAVTGGFIEIKNAKLKIKNYSDNEPELRSLKFQSNRQDNTDDKIVTIVMILADYAVRSEEIEEAGVLEAKKQAEEAMRNREDRAKFVQAESQLRRAVLELKVAAKRRRSSLPVSA